MVVGHGRGVRALGGGTHEKEHRRCNLAEQREILRAHLQRRLIHVLRPHHRLQAGQHARGQCRIVDRGRVAVLLIDVGDSRRTVGGGGVLGVFAGEIPRAPESWQRLGLEWLDRLLREPKRLKRMIRLPKILLLAACERK